MNPFVLVEQKIYFGLQNNKRDECTRSASLNVVRNRLVIELDLMETRYVLFVGFTNKKTFSSLSQHLSCHSFIQKYRLCHIFGVII